MIENLKAVLLNKLNDEVVEYNKIKEQYDQMAEKIKEDNSDFEYDQKKKDLKNKLDHLKYRTHMIESFQKILFYVHVAIL